MSTTNPMEAVMKAACTVRLPVVPCPRRPREAAEVIRPTEAASMAEVGFAEVTEAHNKLGTEEPINNLELFNRRRRPTL